MYRILSDLTFALRLMWRRPALTSAMLAILMFGIGVTTAMYSLVDALIVKPLPYPKSEQLTVVWSTQRESRSALSSYPDFLDWKAAATMMASMASIQSESRTLGGAERHELLQGAAVSGEFFSLLGLPPRVGRLLGPDDDRAGAPPAVVLSAAVWHRVFASDPGVIGRTVLLDDKPFTVVGIAAERFRFAGPDVVELDFWLPMASSVWFDEMKRAPHRDERSLAVIGRLAPGVSLVEAQAQLSSNAQALERQYTEDKDVGIRLADLHETLAGPAEKDVAVLFAAVALVFVVVCAEIASLLLTRAMSRRAEMATRAALGATRRHLAAQMIIESVVLFGVGGLGGALVARGLVDFLLRGLALGPRVSVLGVGVGVDGRVLLFSIAMCLVCGVVFGLVPALGGSRVELHSALKQHASNAPLRGSQSVVRGTLVIAQMALACSLLAGAGLALKAYGALLKSPLGFNPHGLTAQWAPMKTKVHIVDVDSEAQLAHYEALMARVAERPGVEGVAVSSAPPLFGARMSAPFAIDGRPPIPGALLQRSFISAEYFNTLQAHMLLGRDFTAADRRSAPWVVIINKAMADRFFPGENPLGRRIDVRFQSKDFEDAEHHLWREIVGVVDDIRAQGMVEPVAPEAYLPMLQTPFAYMGLVVRTSRPDVVPFDQMTEAQSPPMAVEERLSEAVATQRFISWLLGGFAAFALLLASVAVFGLVSHGAAARTRELGIRMALGSTRGAALRLMMRSGLGLLVAGLSCGTAGSILVGRFLAEHVSGVERFDATVFAVILVSQAASGTLACFIPAWRAVRIPPSVALRYE